METKTTVTIEPVDRRDAPTCHVLLHPEESASTPGASVAHFFCQEPAPFRITQRVSDWFDGRYLTVQAGEMRLCRAHALALLGEQKCEAALLEAFPPVATEAA